MACLSVWFVSILVVSLGPTLSSSSCLITDIGECVGANFSGDCFYNDKIVACVKKFIGQCQGDLLTKANYTINRHEEIRSYCPGIPDGECWYDRAWKCREHLSAFIYLPDNLRLRVGKSDCDSLKYNAARAKDCLRRYAKFCGSKKAKKHADKWLPYIDDGIKFCKKKGL